MKAKTVFFMAAACLAAASGAAQSAGRATVAPFAAGERVSFLGDSITHGGLYHANLQLFWDLRFPGSGTRLMNCGVSGGTAGGGAARWESDVLPQRADRVFVMFGMNDVGHGDYEAASPGNGAAPQRVDEKVAARRKASLDAYRRHMAKIADDVLASGKKLVVVTPTPYDEYGDAYAPAPRRGCNSQGLASISTACRELAAGRKAELLDLHAPLTEFVRSVRDYTFCRKVDRVHPTSDGHVIVTALMLEAMGVSPVVAKVEMNADGRVVETVRAKVSEVRASPRALSFRYAPAVLPFPTPEEYRKADAVYPVSKKMNMEILKVSGLPAGEYELVADGKSVGSFPDGRFAEGVNLALLPTPGAKLAMDAWKVSRELVSLQSRQRTIVLVEAMAAGKGAKPGDFDDVCSKMEAFVQKLEKAGDSSAGYYAGQLKAYRRDKVQIDSLRGQEDDCRRRLAEASAKKASYVLELRPAAQKASSAANARTFDFSAGKWDRGEFFEVRNDDWDRGSPIVQMPDCIMNANNPAWSDEELFKKHQAEVYSALVLTNRFRGDITFSSRMSFDHRMAPSLVIAGELAKDAQGRMAFRDIYEIVLYEDGLNVWRHRRPNGGKSEIEKVAYTAHAFRKKTPYVLKVELKRKKAYGGRPTTDVRVSSDGAEVGFRDETVPAVYSIGLLGSEGRCRFYDLTVDAAALAEASRPAGSLSFGKPFTSGAVLQRNRPVPVWGRAQPGAEVKVSFCGVSAKGKADASGAWRVKLPAMPASSVPHTLSVSTQAEALYVDDVVVGEVWLCAGQSNMAMALVDPYLTRYRDGIGSMVAQAVDQPLVRYLETPVQAGGWRRFTPEFLSSGRRASIAVHYALELHEKLGVPVGVVVAAVGGCNIDSFVPSLGHATNLDRYLLGQVYPLAVRGALWYQGETNLYLGEVEEYGPKMRLLYNRWREMFENPELSFYYVQIAPFARGNNVVHKQKDGTTRVVDYDNRFPRFLCVQAAFEKEEPNAAMTVVNDLGCVGDIHPNEKWLVAKRLALHALRRDYGFAGVEDSSPEPSGATAVSNVVTVTFAHAKRMYAYQRGKRFSPDLPFELAGADGAWRPARVLNFLKGKSMAEGTITNNVVVLSAPGVDRPAAVRYAWKLPWTGSLYNEVDLPLGTFERKVDR